jgi:hypothetical protein
MTETLSLKDKISNNSISAKELLSIKKDLYKHLENESGTLENYCGIYGKELVDLAIKHYPDKFNKQEIDSIAADKLKKLYNKIYANALTGKRITIKSRILHMLSLYMKGEREQTNICIINNSYFSPNQESTSLPEHKNPYSEC